MLFKIADPHPPRQNFIEEGRGFGWPQDGFYPKVELRFRMKCYMNAAADPCHDFYDFACGKIISKEQRYKVK